MKKLLYASLSISFLSISIFACLYLNTLRSVQQEALNRMNETGNLIKNVGIYSAAIALEDGGFINKREAEKYRTEALEDLQEIHPIFFDFMNAMRNSY